MSQKLKSLAHKLKKTAVASTTCPKCEQSLEGSKYCPNPDINERWFCLNRDCKVHYVDVKYR